MQLKLLSDEDSEVIYRTLYATGNLVRYSFFFLVCGRVLTSEFAIQLMSPNVIGALSLTTVDKLRKTAVGVSSRIKEDRIVALARDVSLVPQ